MLRAVYVILAIGVVAALSGGCGEGTETETTKPLSSSPKKSNPGPKEIDITLDGYPSAENVGVLMAHERGYFEDVGLDVWIRIPQSQLKPLRYVADRAVALSITRQPQLVLARQRDVPVVAFGSLVPQPTAALIWLEKEGIGGIADLKGKTVGVTGLPFERSFLGSILARAGMTLADVKVERADYDLVLDLVKGRVDAIFGSWNLEGVELEKMGLKPVITRVQGLGVPSYEELVLITRPDRLSREPEVISAFMTALARGTAAAAENPKAAAGFINRFSFDEFGKATEDQVKATLPLLSKEGRMNPDQASDLMEWMEAEGMIEETLPLSDLFTDEYFGQP